MWDIVKLAKSENKREIIVNGSQLTELIEKTGGKVDSSLFKLDQLNLLRLSNSPSLCEIHRNINSLSQLQSLLLFGNKLEKFPEIDKLVHLKNLDLSKNHITSVDVDFSNMPHLTVVNLSENHISSFNMKSTSIHILNLSMNKFENFPENLPTSLTELNLSKNDIKDIPENLNLTILKFFDISENKITAVPKSLATIKFKTLNIKQNPLKDRKLFKFIDQNQSLKAIMDHIQKMGISSEKISNDSKSKSESAQSEEEQQKIVIHKFDEDFKIEYDFSVKDVRGFILCCLVNNLQFNATNLKEFLQFQTKLHDTLCKKRELSTIATHDFNLIQSKHLKYAAKHKGDIKIHPLNRRDKLLSGSEYFETLKNEAEAFRKEKKRSQVTGVYKFLQLLEDKDQFAFLEEVDSHICLSLPPLTNSDNTKMSVNTTRLLIEVTSHHNAAVCNKVMQELIIKLNEISHAMGNKTLELQQVRIVDNDGILKTLYPSKIDLKELESNSLQIIRP